MALLTVFPFLPVIAIILMIGSIIFKHPKERLESALAEGAIWGLTATVAFSAEILFLTKV